MNVTNWAALLQLQALQSISNARSSSDTQNTESPLSSFSSLLSQYTNGLTSQQSAPSSSPSPLSMLNSANTTAPSLLSAYGLNSYTSSNSGSVTKAAESTEQLLQIQLQTNMKQIRSVRETSLLTVRLKKPLINMALMKN